MIKNPPYTIKEIRALSLKSTNETAEHLAVKRQTIYNWESGHVLIPLNQLQKLIQFCGFDWTDIAFDQIIADTDRMKKKDVIE